MNMFSFLSRVCLSCLVLFLFVVVSLTVEEASAMTVVYVDDFEQFTPGTDLTTINYTPAVGDVNSAFFSVFGAGTNGSKQAVNFGCSTAVLLDQPINTGRPAF